MKKITKQIFRNFIFPIALKIKLPVFFDSFSKNNFLILNYHGVVEEKDLNLSQNHMDTLEFSKHMDYLKKNYQIVPLDQITKEIKNGIKPSKKTISITFDDGYENNYEFAFPTLKKLNIPATIFITTKYTDTDDILWYDELDFIKNNIEVNKIRINEIPFETKYDKLPASILSISQLKSLFKRLLISDKKIFLDWLKNEFKIENQRNIINPQFWRQLNKSQIHEMYSSGLINFGSHTENHPNLDLISITNAHTELNNSREKLTNLLNHEIDSIAFPDGAYNEAVKSECKSIGYNSLFAVNYRCKNDDIAAGIFKRFSISNSTTFESVMLQISLAFDKSGH